MGFYIGDPKWGPGPLGGVSEGVSEGVSPFPIHWRISEVCGYMSEALAFSPVHWLKDNFSSRLETLWLRSCNCSQMSPFPEDPAVCVPSDPLVAFLQKLAGTCCWVHVDGPFFCVDTWNELKAAGLSISPQGWVPSGCIPDWVAGTMLCSHLEASIPPRRSSAVASKMNQMFPSMLI